VVLNQNRSVRSSGLKLGDWKNEIPSHCDMKDGNRKIITRTILRAGKGGRGSKRALIDYKVLRVVFVGDWETIMSRAITPPGDNHGGFSRGGV